MDRLIDKLFRPEIVWVLIPLAAIVFWGINSVANSFRSNSGNNDDLEQWMAEVDALRTRVEELERTQRRG